jgi:hypothetical protein
MTGGTVVRDRIAFNRQEALDARLASKQCKPFGPNVEIATPGKVRYPDALVTCWRTRNRAPDPTVVGIAARGIAPPAASREHSAPHAHRS